MDVSVLGPHSKASHVWCLPSRLQQGAKAALRSGTVVTAKRVADSGYFADADPKGAWAARKALLSVWTSHGLLYR